MDELITELNIDKSRITGVSHKSAAWNIKMMATTALLSAFGIAPYIFLNLGANNLNTSKKLAWVLPVLHATLIQLLIQQRITSLSHKFLVNGVPLPTPVVDTEAAVQVELGLPWRHEES
jgi:hypothetical protein